MKQEEHSVAQTIQRFRSFRYGLILEGIAVGALAGAVVVGFRYLLGLADLWLRQVLAFASAHPLLIPVWFCVLALGALAVALLLRWEPLISGSGIPQLEGEMLGELDQKWWRVLVAKLAGGMLSLGCGLSLGREGPSIQIGAMTAKGFSRLTRRCLTEEKLLLTCGASAGLAAAFNAPIAGVLFSLEEIHKRFSPEILLSSMAASITADFVSRNVFGLKPVFAFSIPSMMPLSAYGHVLLLGLVLGLLGVAYNVCLSKTQDLYGKISSQYVRLLTPFLLAGVVAFVYPALLGGGHGLVEALTLDTMTLEVLALLFVLKFCFSMASFGAGAPGGIFLPLLVLGAVIGSVYYAAAGVLGAQLPGLLNNFIILGMAGYFAAIVRAPITGILLISEMTGSFSHLLTLSIVALTAYLVPDILRCAPVYDQLLHRLLRKLEKEGPRAAPVKKVLVESQVAHGCPAEGLCVSQLKWPRRCLAISVVRGDVELVPRGDTVLRAGDRLVVLCDGASEAKLHRMLEESCRLL